MGIPTGAIDHRTSARRRRIRPRVARQSDRHRWNSRSHHCCGENVKGERVRIRIGRLAVRVSTVERSSTSERDQVAGCVHHSRSAGLPHHRIRGVWLVAVST